MFSRKVIIRTLMGRMMRMIPFFASSTLSQQRRTPPRKPRPLNEACEVVRNFLQNAIVLTGQDIKTIRGIMTELDHNEAVMVSDYNEPITPLTPEYYNEILKRFNETRK